MARTTIPKTYVFANANCALTTEDGTPVVLARGDAWDASDPLCLFRPEFFDAEPAVDMLKRTYLPAGFDIFGDPLPAVVG